MAVSAIVLDVDGTLWDSRPWLIRLIADETGEPMATIEDEFDSGRSVVAIADRLRLSRTRLAGLCSASAHRLKLYPAVTQVLGRWTARGVPLGLASSMSPMILQSALATTGLIEFFPVVIHPGNCRARKPSPEPLLQALSQLGVRPGNDAWYVGDESHDEAAARAAGVSFAWASHGYGPDVHGADFVAHKAADLSQL